MNNLLSLMQLFQGGLFNKNQSEQETNKNQGNSPSEKSIAESYYPESYDCSEKKENSPPQETGRENHCNCQKCREKEKNQSESFNQKANNTQNENGLSNIMSMLGGVGGKNMGGLENILPLLSGGQNSGDIFKSLSGGNGGMSGISQIMNMFGGGFKSNKNKPSKKQYSDENVVLVKNFYEKPGDK